MDSQTHQILMYGIEFPARSLVSVACEETTQFIVGSLGLKAENQLVRLEIDDEFSQISTTIFPHSCGEVWAIASHPSRPDLVGTCFLSSELGREVKCGAVLWQMRGDRLDKLATLELQTGVRKADAIAFCREGRTVGITSDQTLSLFSIDDGGVQKTREETIAYKKLVGLTWNPHSSGVALAADSSVVCIDTRSFEVQNVISEAHSRMRQVAFNPNIPNVVATAGDDGAAIWDLRKSTQPLHTIGDHLHWVWNAQYNPIHDQLLLTSSSDTKVYLHNLGSLSSDASHDEEGMDRLPDGRLDSVEEHEESVYGCTWAGNDPWIYASLSYDGRVIVSRVRREHKYRILQI